MASDPADKIAAVVQTEEVTSTDGSESPRPKPTLHHDSRQPPELKLDVDQIPVNPRVQVEEPTPEPLGGHESRALESFE